MADAMANPPKLTDPKLQAGWENGKGRFLIDGFPRKMDQALMFDKVVSTSCVLFASWFIPSEISSAQKMMMKNEAKFATQLTYS